MKPIEPYELRVFKTKGGEEPFTEWIKALDDSVRARIRARITRVEAGNLGDCKAVGGVFELRLDFGPGYRVYFGIIENRIVLLLCGGSKRGQAKDIKRARKFWHEYKESL